VGVPDLTSVVPLPNINVSAVSVPVAVTSHVFVVYQAPLVMALLFKDIGAEPSKDTPAIALAVSSIVAVQALPVIVVCVVSISQLPNIVVEFTVFMLVLLTSVSCLLAANHEYKLLAELSPVLAPETDAAHHHIVNTESLPASAVNVNVPVFTVKAVVKVALVTAQAVKLDAVPSQFVNVQALGVHMSGVVSVIPARVNAAVVLSISTAVVPIYIVWSVAAFQLICHCIALVNHLT